MAILPACFCPNGGCRCAARRWPARLPLADIADLSRHTLLHVATMPRLWNDWLRAAGATEVDQGAALTFDHFYLAVQAALDGLGGRDGSHRAGR